jgi:uncharacterized protein
MILDSNSRKPEIDYPCQWEYKVIGKNVDQMLAAIENAASGLEYSVTPSNVSKNGNYFSLNFSLEVPNEVVRNIVYKKLGENEDVIMVL